MSFANQALSAEYVAQHANELEPKVYVVPEEIDREIARLKLETLGVEIDIPGIAELAESRRPARANVEEFTLPGGRKINLVADGRLVNLSAAEGHPAAVMDMSVANQALSAEYVAQHAD